MLVATTILVLMSTKSVFAQVYCVDDGQCSDGLFCDQSTFACRPCMDCNDLNRSPLPAATTTTTRALDEDTCIKSDDDCGPCLESYTTSQWNSKCVVPEDESFFSPNTVWLTCAALGLLITGIFVYLIIHTNVYEIVRYYVPTNSPMSLPWTVQGYPMTKINVVLISRTQEIIV